MKDIVTHIIAAYLINKELNSRRDEADSNQKGKTDKRTSYSKLAYPKLEDTRTLDTKGTLLHHNKLVKDKPHLRNVEKFISWLQVVDTKEDSTRNVTWIELYILYRLRGYHKPLGDPERPGLKRATLDTQLREFKRNFRTVATKLFEGTESAPMLKLAKQHNDVLIGVGIQGKHNCLAFNVYTTGDEQKEIARALTTLNRSITKTHLKEYIEGRRGIVPHPLNLNGKTGWDSSLPILNNERRLDCRYDNNQLTDVDPVEEVAFFKCPRPSCSKVESSSAKNF